MNGCGSTEKKVIYFGAQTKQLNIRLETFAGSSVHFNKRLVKLKRVLSGSGGILLNFYVTVYLKNKIKSIVLC